MAEKVALKIPLPGNGSLEGDLTAVLTEMLGVTLSRVIARGFQMTMAESQTANGLARQAKSFYGGEVWRPSHGVDPMTEVQT